jgi:hypothetical protein
MRTRTGLLLALLSLPQAACELRSLDGDVAAPEPVHHVRSLNGVKLISPEIGSPYDPGTVSQAQYALSDRRRLLLRFEELTQQSSGILISENRKLEAQVTLGSDGEAADAETALLLCPVTRNWMMLATWERAHPFSDDGRWENAGGDYEASGCVKPHRREKRAVWFDVSQWFLDYPRGRGINYGFILVAAQALTVEGDASASDSPRLLWQQNY